jgi:hypothetical protein
MPFINVDKQNVDKHVDIENVGTAALGCPPGAVRAAVIKLN